MGMNIDKGDKILSIISSGLNIILVVGTIIFKPEWINYALFIAVILIALTIIFLSIKIAIQSKKIKIQNDKILDLENNRCFINQELAKKEERISQLEQLMNVPFFQKWNLLYTFMWRNAIPFLKNPVYLDKIHVIRKLVGTGRIKDNIVSYKFSGESAGEIKSFLFCIAGAGNIPLKKIQFHVKDLTTNLDLEYSALKKTQDSNIKFIEIYFRDLLHTGNRFEIEISWKWPKTAFVESDYFSLPNIYSIKTKHIVIDLFPTEDMNLESVETYKFGLNDIEPKKIDHLYKNKDGFYRSIIDNPDKNADYITYYE